MENFHAADAAEAAYANTTPATDVASHAEWLKAQHEEFPPIRVKSPQDDDPDFTGVWFGGWLGRNIPEEDRYAAPVKRGPGRPRKDGKPAGSAGK